MKPSSTSVRMPIRKGKLLKPANKAGKMKCIFFVSTAVAITAFIRRFNPLPHNAAF